jgi:hypothetical protein
MPEFLNVSAAIVAALFADCALLRKFDPSGDFYS